MAAETMDLSRLTAGTDPPDTVTDGENGDEEL